MLGSTVKERESTNRANGEKYFTLQNVHHMLLHPYNSLGPADINGLNVFQCGSQAACAVRIVFDKIEHREHIVTLFIQLSRKSVSV